MTDTTETRRLARITGVLYLIVILCAGFAEGYVWSSLVVPGDPSATARNIMESEWLFRLGFAADLVAFIADAAIAVLLYVLLKPVSKTLSQLAASMRLLAHPAIASINLLSHFGVLILLGGADYLGAFDTAQREALALVLMDSHTYGYLIGGAFFGMHCLLLGYLLVRSPRFPSLLGILMAVAAVGYLVESFGNFLVPGHEALLTWVVAVPAALGEISLALWLVVRGVRSSGAGGSR